jgi:Flp pilus assembly protein TadB
MLESCLAGFIERLHVHPPHRDLLPQSASRPWLYSCCGTARRRRLLLVTSFVDAAATATLGLSSPRISIIRTLACDIQWPWHTLQALLVLVLMVVLVLLLVLLLLLLLLLLLVVMLQLVLLLMLLLQVRRRAEVFPSR